MKQLLTKNGVSLLLPFIMITTCFALWGFANDVTAPMVKAFSKIFRMSVTEGALVPVSFYFGYFVMPAIRLLLPLPDSLLHTDMRTVVP